MNAVSVLGEYHHDIFYKVHELPIKTMIQLLKDAKEISYHWWVDILNCSKSFYRQRIESTFEEALEKAKWKNTHFVFIHRRGYESWNKKGSISEWRLETGYRTMTGPVDYFLWINVKEDRIPELVEKYELEVLR